MKCLYCQKEIISERSTKRYCSSACRIALHRKKDSVTKIIPVSVTKDKDSVTEKVTVTKEAELKFTKEMPLSERIKKFKEAYPDSSFVPNWVAHGYLSKQQAISTILKEVRKNDIITKLGLGGEE